MGKKTPVSEKIEDLLDNHLTFDRLRANIPSSEASDSALLIALHRVRKIVRKGFEYDEKLDCLVEEEIVE